MRKVYRLARVNRIGDNVALELIGPNVCFTLDKAESYAADMRKAGFDVLVVNTESE